MNENLEGIFHYILNLMKLCNSSNETRIKFVELFKESLVLKFKKIDANFNTEEFFRKIFQENLVLIDINLQENKEILKKLNIKENDQMKELMESILCQKISKLEEENIVLKVKLEEANSNEKSLKEEIKEMDEKMKKMIKIRMKNQGKKLKKLKKN